MEERLEEHSQLTKARALSQLRVRLCRLELQGLDADVDWSILSLLFSLSTRPLDTGLPPPLSSHPAVVKSHADPAYLCDSQQRRHHPKHHDDAEDSSPDENEAWDATSELSDWSEAENPSPGSPMQCDDSQAAMNDTNHAGETSVPQAPDGGSAPVSVPVPPPPTDGGSVWAHLAQRIASASLARERAVLASNEASLLSIGPSCRRVASASDDLLPCLGRTRLGFGAGFGGLSIGLRPTDCRSDPDLVHQTLSILLGGHPSSGSALPSTAELAEMGSSGRREAYFWDERRGRPVPRRGLQVPYLSPTQLHGLLDRLAEAGGRMYRLRQISDLSSGKESLKLPVGLLHGRMQAEKHVPVTPAVRAFMTAIRAQLDRLAQPLICLQEYNLSATSSTEEATTPAGDAMSNDDEGKPAPLTLQALAELTEACSRRLCLLHDVAREALTALLASAEDGNDPHPLPADSNRSGANSSDSSTSVTASRAAATASSVLIDSLHSQLCRRATLGGPANQSGQRALLHLFLCTLVPMMEGLQSWLNNSDGLHDSWPRDFFIKAADK